MVTVQPHERDHSQRMHRPVSMPDRNRFVFAGRGFPSPGLCGPSGVVLQEAAQTLAADDALVASRLSAKREKQHVAQALMVAFMVIVRDELAYRAP